MKKIVIMIASAVLLSVVAFTGFGMAATVDSGTCGDNLEWVLTDDGTLTISGTGAMYDDCRPWTSYRSQITKLNLSEGITTLGARAFEYCSNLISVIIPDSVTSIGNFAFDNCLALPSITIPDSVTSIGDDIFGSCYNLTSVTLSNNITTIPENAFGGCGALTSVNIPNGVTSIEFCAFAGCGALPSVIIPDSVTSIGNHAFDHCLALTSISIPDSVTTIGEEAFRDCSALTSISIPDSVTTIRGGAFCYCSNLTSVNIPNGVTSIGNYAFQSCSALPSITIPDSVTSIGNLAFCNCRNLTSISIPNSLTSIGKEAFRYCSALTSISIPNGVTSIGEWTFEDCSNLTSVAIPNSVTSIGNYAFYGCSNLASVAIPNSVTSIGKQALAGFEQNSVVYTDGNPSLLSDETYSKEKSVVAANVTNNAYSFTVSASDFPSGFPLTNENAPVKDGKTFEGWYTNPGYTGEKVTTVSNGQTLYAKWSGEPGSVIDSGTCGDHLTWTLTDDGTLTISGTGAMYDYDSDYDSGKPRANPAPWYQYRNQITSVILPYGLTTIGNSTFEKCYNLDGPLTIPSSVTTIGNSTFEKCYNLDGPLTIPDSVTTIGNRAFHECWGLNGSLTIPDSVITIGNNAFGNCIGFTGKLVIPNSVTTIGKWAFSSCYGLNGTLTLPNSITTIDEGAFSGCKFTGTLTIPNSVTTIGKWAFSSCYGLNGTLTLPNSITTIGNNAFEGCSGLTSVVIPNSVTSIGEGAFYCCQGLIGITLPESCTSVNKTLFRYCVNLSAVNIPNGVTFIGQNAFEDCRNLTNLTLPNGLTDIATNAFSYCSALESLSIPSSVTYIGNQALTNLKQNSVIYTDGNPSLLSDGTYSKDKSAVATSVSNNAYTFTVSTSNFPLTTGNAPVREGKTFEGWYANSGYSGEKVTAVSNGQTLYANWDLPTYCITNSTGNGTVVANKSNAVVGATVHVDAFNTTVGYHFNDWNVTNSTGKITVDGNGNFQMPASVVNVGADFTANVAKVTFDNGTGSETKDNTYGLSTVKPADPVKSGYMFVGWNVSIDSGWEPFDDAKYNKSGVWSYTGDHFSVLSVVANWSVNSYAVNYTMNGHGTQVTNTTAPYGSTVIEPTTPTETGYTFNGWYSDNGLTNLYDFKTPVTANVDLYANWTVTEYTITYYLDGGSATNPSTYNLTTPTITLSAASKLGYAFEGWYNASSKSAEFKNNSIPLGSTENKEFWANYTGNITTVVFHIDGTTEDKLNSYNQAINFSATPTKSGYTFSHWNVSSTGEDLNSSTYVKNGIWNYTGENGKTLDVYANWTKVHLDLYPGWNVVSTPKKLSSAYDTAAELFADVNTTGHAVLTYNAQTKSWEQITASTKIEPLNAYWIYSNESKILPYEFSSTVSSPAVKSVYKGWNAVSLSADEPMSAAETFGNTNWYTYLEWNAASQAFKSPLIKGGSGTHADTNLVSLWTGGWLFLNEDGTYMGFTA